MCCFRWTCARIVASQARRVLERSHKRVVFVGPFVQSARFHDCRFASFPRAVQECQILISWQAQLFDRFACRCNVVFRDRRSTLEFFVQISWQAQHFGAFRADFVAGAVLLRRCPGRRSTLGGSHRSRRGAVHLLKTQSEPCAHFGWVESLSLWRGAHLSNEKRMQS